MLEHATRLREDDTEYRSAFEPLPYSSDLTWVRSKGYGYYEITEPAAYDQAYFDKYTGYAHTLLGQRLTQFRVHMVNSYLPDGMDVTDIGIGCGQFVDAMATYGPVFGFDVNPVAVEWLKQSGRFRNPSAFGPGPIGAMTFWDSFEHLRRPMDILACRPRFVFMSLPIFQDAAHVLRSKHFRRDEHYWYFSTWGLIREMDRAGYDCLEVSRAETRLGREDIGSFAFQRR